MCQLDKDFDFSGNTQKFSANFKETGFTEEEAFFAKRRTKEESGKEKHLSF
jgi:DNA topoisomerase 2-associated protein PAT1